MTVNVQLLEARRARRQRPQDQIEIANDQLASFVNDDVLARGEFGTVYIADYNGRNAAVKVVVLAADPAGLGLGRGDEEDNDESRHQQQVRLEEGELLLRELEAMVGFSSPHTVRVYEAITSCKDRLVLVMELLTGGDLRTLLERAAAEQPIPVDRARCIVRDVCAGMVFLHGKSMVHGDLRCCNVLFDGAGRAKVGGRLKQMGGDR